MSRVQWNVQETFRKLLGDVSRDMEMLLRDLRQAINKGDRKEIRRLAHSMAGAGSNISAYDFSKAARRVEHVADKEREDTLSGLLDSVEAELSRVVASVASLEQNPADQEGPGKENAVATDMDALRHLLETLEESLNSLDPLGSSEIIERISGHALPRDMEEEIKKIDMLVRDFGLDEAGEMLAEIIGRLRDEG